MQIAKTFSVTYPKTTTLTLFCKDHFEINNRINFFFTIYNPHIPTILIIIDKINEKYTIILFSLKFRHVIAVSERKHVSLKPFIFTLLYGYSMKKMSEQFSVFLLAFGKSKVSLP